MTEGLTASGLTVSGVVVDIEGTTSATAAVHVGLYDHARPRITSWLREHADEASISAAIDATIADAGLAPDASTDDVAATMLQWMDDDVKATPLKTVQGQIWAAGFADGALAPHFFDDVAPALDAWRRLGLGLAVFSSGSVEVQRPWFANGLPDDVVQSIDGYFDTVNAGPKREAGAYHSIAETLTDRWSCRPADLVFLSDVPAELDAAREARWQTIGVRRPSEPNGDVDFGIHPTVASFAEIHLGRTR